MNYLVCDRDIKSTFDKWYFAKGDAKEVFLRFGNIRRKIMDSAFLLQSAAKLTDLTLEEDIYHFIAQQMQSLNENSIISVSLYDEDTGTMQIKEVAGLGKFAGSVAALMGGLPVGRSMTLEASARNELLQGKLSQIENGLADLSPDLPKPVWRSIEKLLGVEKAYSMGFVWKGRLYGNVVIVLPAKSNLCNKELIEVFVALVSVTLQNRNIQNRLDQAYREVESKVEKRTAQLTREVEHHKKTLRLLEENEEGYRLLAETANEMIITITLDGIITYVNKRGLELSGYSSKEAIGTDFSQIIPKKSVQTLKVLLDKRAEGFAENLLYETQFIAKNGNVVPVEVSSNLIVKKEKPFGVLITARDITERIKTEARIKKSEERYRGLVDTMQEGLAEVDKDWNITFVNQRFARMMAYEPDQMIGKCFHDLMSPRSRSIAKDQHRLRNDGVTSRYEAELIRADNKKIFVQCSPNPVYDSKGRYQGGLGVISDITHRKKTELALAESERKYRDLFENVSDFIYFHDLKGHFIETNLASQKESGYTKEDLAGKNIRHILADKSDARFDEYMDEVIGAGKSEGLIKVVTKTGEKRILEYRNSLVMDQKGPVGIRGCARDITERIDYENRLKQEKKKLEEALEHINTLSGLLPICATCKKIRDDKGYWNHLESYIEKHSDAAFSHSICPQCSDEIYGDQEWYIKMKKKKSKSNDK
jgi:PAS domain S-box-containing protein